MINDTEKTEKGGCAMRLFTQAIGLASVVIAVLLIGCETSRDDATAARNRVDREQRRLEDMKRDAPRNVEEERQEARDAHVTNKPILGDDINEGSKEEAREAERKAVAEHQRIRDQQEAVREAKADAEQTEKRLAMEQSRDKFLIDCKSATDQANRAIEKLQTMKNDADEAEQKSLNDRTDVLKAKRDELQEHINSIRSADVMRWSDHKAMAQKAMDELLKDVKSIE
jgi:hypothetical protein